MSEFSGIKVLIVEDEGFVALLIEDMLQDLGCEIVASVAGLKEACMVAETAQIDFAVLCWILTLAGSGVFLSQRCSESAGCHSCLAPATE